MKTSKFKNLIVWILLMSGLLLIGACAGGGGYQGPDYERPAYYSPYNRNYYAPYFPYSPDDPEFLQMWGNSQGGG
jgi:hypothetical protein